MATMAEVAAYYPALAELAKASEEEVERTYIDGPSIAAWIKERGIGRGDESVRFRVRRWAEGGVAHCATVDKVLTGTDYSLNDIPEDFWAERRAGDQLSDEERRTIAREYLNAEHQDQFTRATVADKYGVSVHHVRKLVSDYRGGRL